MQNCVAMPNIGSEGICESSGGRWWGRGGQLARCLDKGTSLLHGHQGSRPPLPPRTHKASKLRADTFGVGHAGGHQEGNCWASGKKLLIFLSHMSFAPFPPQISTFLRQRLAWAWANREGHAHSRCLWPIHRRHPEPGRGPRPRPRLDTLSPAPLCVCTCAGVTAPLQLKRLAERN